MTDPTSPAIAPGWYPDPAGGPRSRWWDGSAWSEHFQEPYSVVALKAPAGIPVYTVWIWLQACLPILSIVSLLAVDWSSYTNIDINDPYASQNAQLAIMTSPGYILSTVLGWVVVGLGVLFAVLDWRTLNRRGVPRPFHWAFAFLGIVYTIGRSVVIRRRTGHGIAPMWVAIAIAALSVLAGVAVAVAVFSNIMSSVQYQLQY